MDETRAKHAEADGIVVGTPAYYNNPTRHGAQFPAAPLLQLPRRPAFEGRSVRCELPTWQQQRHLRGDESVLRHPRYCNGTFSLPKTTFTVSRPGTRADIKGLKTMRSTSRNALRDADDRRVEGSRRPTRDAQAGPLRPREPGGTRAPRRLLSMRKARPASFRHMPMASVAGRAREARPPIPASALAPWGYRSRRLIPHAIRPMRIGFGIIGTI